MKRIAILVALALAPACGRKEEKSEPAKPSSTFECKVFVKKKGGAELKGQGSAATDLESKQAAWKDVCAQVPAEFTADCNDHSQHYSPTVVTMSATSAGATNFTTTVTLKEIVPQIDGKATSEKDSDTACQAAREKACEKAGQKGDCVASGGFEEAGRMAESTTVTPKF